MTNKVRDIKVLPDGTYEVVLGSFADPFRDGMQYDAESVREAFRKRVRTGREMYVEFGSPRGRSRLRVDDNGNKLSEGIVSFSAEQAIQDVMTIHEDRVCGVLCYPMGEDENHMIGRFKPFGPYGDIVRKMLADPEEILHFGLRGFTKVTQWPERALTNLITFDLIQPKTGLPPKEEEVITATRVAPRPEPELEIEIRGNRPHIGKSRVIELIRRTLEEHGYTGVKVVSQDNDQKHFESLHAPELRADGFLQQMPITLIDNNQKLSGVKQ
ncbi:S80 family phage morphogenetic serine protease [Streptomyces sp. CHB9.2]|uniref:S80 family phage morphogenetic serine protease n=1 Tax=Streptomyces sp. CHB9.2 TaxID=2841670 RepID=UPI0020947908|nr:S80 family phage morphogenetic serine protease [Streptomyces sp. CHB9.2]MCO6704732.1 hypothetical protein [Streptomyces sp. CHB9.2]